MTLTPEQAQAQAAAIRSRSGGDSRVVALRHTGPWPGPDTLSVSGEVHTVIACISDLQMRDALGQLEGTKSAGILLCDVDPAALGEDVLARLVRRRIHHPQWDEMLRELFAARVVDARILASRPLVDALIRSASASGYSPTPGGTLDLEFAWKAVLRKQLGVEVTEISFVELLRWTTIPRLRTCLLEMPLVLRAELARWLAPNYAEAPRHLFYVLDSELGTDLVALGLLFGLLLAGQRAGVADTQAAAARLEQYFGTEPLKALSLQTWFQASSNLFDKAAETEVFQLHGIVQSLDKLIERVRLQASAHLSDHSSTGLEQRLVRAGEAIGEASKQTSDTLLDAARQSLERVARHGLSSYHEARFRRLQMGFRLVLWLRTNNLPAPTEPLSQLIHYYSNEGGFVDWARSMISESDPHPQIKEALWAVLEKVETRWITFHQQFANRLQQWSMQGMELRNAFRIEEVLWAVASPVAREHPALLIVLDGMSQAVFRELVSDLLRRNWVELAAPAPGTPRNALATIPSVTEFSRRALLSGRLQLGAQGTEKSDFNGNERLFEQIGGQSRPQLFLKGDLVEAGRMGLSEPVKHAVSNSRCRLVGVVVNAVDESLGSSDQTSYSWGLDQVAPLHELMRMASESGRVVILTSDHGHVLDEGSQVIRQPLPETGDRYRLPGGNLSEAEMEFRGSRVQATTGSESVIALAARRCRYQGKRRGYHGGVCPAEMVVPCAVFRSSNTAVPDAWEDLPPYEPEWWSVREPVVDGVQVMVEQPLSSRRPLMQKQTELFQHPTKTADGTAAWIEQLMLSSTYQQQARAAVRGAPVPEEFRRFLLLLNQRNGRIQRGNLAQQLGTPLIRVDGLIQNYRRLLNVDGYDVLSYDQPTETIVLNIELMKSQFEL